MIGQTLLREGVVAVAGFVALIAGYTDWRWRRIPNWLTVSGAAVGIAANGLALGWPGVKTSLQGLGLGLLLLFPFVLIRALGAGDWKLAGAMGALLGPGALLTVLVVAILVAGVMAAGLIIQKKRVGESLRNMGKILMALLTGHPGDPSVSLNNPESLKVPFGVAFAAAVILYLGHRFLSGTSVQVL
jgi:prepilin peptidase CpaA